MPGGTQMCAKCNQTKTWRAGLDVQKIVGQRRVRLFVCWDCVLAHYRRCLKEWPLHLRGVEDESAAD